MLDPHPQLFRWALVLSLVDKFAQTAYSQPKDNVLFLFFNMSCTSYFLIVLTTHLTEQPTKRKDYVTL